EAEPVGSAIQLPKSAHWTLGQRIEAEKEAFGFFFSAHPLDRYQHLARLHSARSIASLNEIVIADGGRAGATIAALIEDARWRTSARGKRYMMATISDASGMVPCTCFEELTAKEMEEASRVGGCGILTIELDRRPGEDTPRVTVRKVQPFEGIAKDVRLTLHLLVDDPGALPALASLLADARG